MKYFAVNEHIENEIKAIKQEIHLSMNGICSDNMSDLGLNYKINFGVSWIRLQNIAKNHTKNYEIAERLWFMPIRETKLIATILCPPAEINDKRLNEWTKEIINPELAEIISLSLLSKNITLTPYIINLLQDKNYCLRLTALHTLARTIKTLSVEDIKKIITFLPTDIINISTYRATEALLLNTIFQTKEVDFEIKKWITQIKNSPTQHSHLLYNIINEELEHRLSAK